MTLSIDPQVGAAMQKLAEAMGKPPRPPLGDWRSRRLSVEVSFAAFARLQPTITDVSTRDFSVRSYDGAEVRLRWFQKSATQPGSAVLYVHGGGMIGGSVEIYDAVLKRLVSMSGVPFLAVDYRLAPEHANPTPVEDCYAGLQWLAENAEEFGIDPSRIAIMGDSAGGGHAAATALVARDRRGPALAKQVLIYPMLDDRNSKASPQLLPFATWTWDDNITGWGALLGTQAGTDGAHEYAVASRARDLSRLPATYIEVGQLDIFCDEVVAYAHRLLRADVQTELLVIPGVPHGFELFAPDAEVSRRAMANRLRALKSF